MERFRWIFLAVIGISVVVSVYASNEEEAAEETELGESSADPESKTDYVFRIRIRNKNVNTNVNANKFESSSPRPYYRRYDGQPPYGEKYARIVRKPSQSGAVHQNPEIKIIDRNKFPLENKGEIHPGHRPENARVIHGAAKEKLGDVENQESSVQPSSKDDVSENEEKQPNATQSYIYDLNTLAPAANSEDMPFVAVHKRKQNLARSKVETNGIDHLEVVSPDELRKILRSLDGNITGRQAQLKGNYTNNANVTFSGGENKTNTTVDEFDIHYGYEIIFSPEILNRRLNFLGKERAPPKDPEVIIHEAWTIEKPHKQKELQDRAISDKNNVVAEIEALKKRAKEEALNLRIIGPPPYHPMYQPFEKITVPFKKYNKRMNRKLWK